MLPQSAERSNKQCSTECIASFIASSLTLAVTVRNVASFTQTVCKLCLDSLYPATPGTRQTITRGGSRKPQLIPGLASVAWDSDNQPGPGQRQLTTPVMLQIWDCMICLIGVNYRLVCLWRWDRPPWYPLMPPAPPFSGNSVTMTGTQLSSPWHSTLQKVMVAFEQLLLPRCGLVAMEIGPAICQWLVIEFGHLSSLYWVYV